MKSFLIIEDMMLLMISLQQLLCLLRTLLTHARKVECWVLLDIEPNLRRCGHRCVTCLMSSANSCLSEYITYSSSTQALYKVLIPKYLE
jgi:hypothetical protein